MNSQNHSIKGTTTVAYSITEVVQQAQEDGESVCYCSRGDAFHVRPDGSRRQRGGSRQCIGEYSDGGSRRMQNEEHGVW